MTTEYKIDLIGNSLYFTGHINQSSAHEFTIKLQQLEDSIQGKEDKQVNLYLSSQGGDVASGFRMYESLKFFEGEVICYPEGFVASSAVTVMCAASKVISSPLTTFLIHQITTWVDGKFYDNKAVFNWHEAYQNIIADIYSKKTNGKVTASMLKEETYLTAEQARELGLVDEIINYIK
jgi:ATP-dependent Clp protease protease subunit